MKYSQDGNMISSIKCYKSMPCILSVLIILFISGAIIYDLVFAKPKMERNIYNINAEITNINKHIEQIDSQQISICRKFSRFSIHH